MICLNHGFIHQTWHFQASGSFQKSTVTCLLALKIFKESRQSQRCFKQWLLCSNTCIVKVTILHENIYLAILVYLWKTRTKTKKKKKKPNYFIVRGIQDSDKYLNFDQMVISLEISFYPCLNFYDAFYFSTLQKELS